MQYRTAIAVRFPQKDMESINECIEKGFASNTTDFVRLAVRKEIERCKVEAC